MEPGSSGRGASDTEAESVPGGTTGVGAGGVTLFFRLWFEQPIAAANSVVTSARRCTGSFLLVSTFRVAMIRQQRQMFEALRSTTSDDGHALRRGPRSCAATR